MKARIVVSFALVALVLVVFAQVRTFAFVHYDDNAYVFNNTDVREGFSGAGLRYAFTTTTMGNYNPLVWLSFFADYTRAGLDPDAYHVTNLVLHAANALLLFWLFVRLTGHMWPSAFVAAVFAVHPAHVESVAWVSERKDVLSTFFWFAATLAYTAYARQPSWRRYAPVLVLFALGLLSKPMLVTFPFTLLLFDWWPLQRGRLRRQDLATWRGLVVEKLPLLALSLVAGAGAVYAQRVNDAMPPVDRLGLGARLATATVGYMRYLGKAVWPVDLVPYYPYPAGGYATLAVVAAALVLIGATLVAWGFRRTAPYGLVGWLWFLGTLIPVIGLVQVGGQAIADRYTYVPYVGLTVPIAWMARAVATTRPRWRIPITVVAVGVVAAFTVLAHGQTARWRDTLTLFHYTLEVSPENPVALAAIGEYYLERERWAEAERMYERAARADPQNVGVWVNLGKARRNLERFDAARSALERALTLDEESTGALNQLALLAGARGDRAMMRRFLERALAVDPDNLDAHVNLGNWFLESGEPDRAEQHYRAALTSDRNQPDALSNLGAIALLREQPADAIALFMRSLERGEEDAVTLTNLGVAYFMLGDRDAARSWADRAIAVDPAYAKARALRRRTLAGETP